MTTARLSEKALLKLKKLQLDSLGRGRRITQQELLERAIDFAVQHEESILETRAKAVAQDPLLEWVRKPVKSGHQTDCVQEIDVTL